MKKIFTGFILMVSFFIFTSPLKAQTTSFVYQGKLQDGGAAANGTYQFQFKLYDTDAGGNQIGLTLSDIPATVTNGIFAVQLNFGAGAFSSAQFRFLEIAVRQTVGNQAYTTLTPRQQVASTPFAIRALSAQAADDAANLGGIPAAQYVVTTDPRMSDDRNPLPDSPNYIQNGLSTQASANFNISGEGRADIFSASTQFNIGANRVLTATVQNNLFAGFNAGAGVTTGYQNSFFGNNAGAKTTTGFDNAFFGNFSGNNNTNGTANSFFGAGSGVNNLTGNNNAFFGMEAGLTNNSGSGNTFIGRAAGFSNTTENNNTFIGYNANGAAGVTNATAIGYNAKATLSNTMVLGTDQILVQVPGSLSVANTFSANALDSATVYKIAGVKVFHTFGTDNTFVGKESGNSIAAGGNYNAFFGAQSGKATTTGLNNSFFGAYSGVSNLTGSNNAFFGTNTGLVNTSGSTNSFFGANTGFSNTTGSNNSLFGNLAGSSITIAGNNSMFGARAGENTTTGGNAFFGTFAGQKTTTGFGNVFVGMNSGKENIAGSSNTFVGTDSGFFPNVSGNNNTTLGADAKISANVSNATAVGAGAIANTSNSVVLGNASANTFVPGELTVTKSANFGNNIGVGGTAFLGSLNVSGGELFTTVENSTFKLKMPGGAIETGVVQTSIVNGSTAKFSQEVEAKHLIFQFPSTGANDSVCFYSLFDPNKKILAQCSSSIRYKENVQDFKGGLDVVRRLRAVTFDWKRDGSRDVGFIAEEVNEIEPLLSTYNAQGQVQGVKYAQVTTVLVNAVREQQTEIEKLEERIKRQNEQLESLKTLVCSQNPGAAICAEKSLLKPTEIEVKDQ